MKKAVLKSTARVLILTLTYQLLFPVCALALTTGPSTPEVQSFEPVGTTDMVDLFTGDFNYNIPLMDVEGFPINIAYHSGVSIEQEASWVGLGWNINPGEINRSVRGLPDDFDGETIEKTIHIEDEVNYRVGTGISASLELFGFDPTKYGFDLSVGLGSYIAYSNYKGVSLGGNVGVTVSTPVASTGVDVGLGSQSGVDVDVNANLHTSMAMTQDVGAGIGVSGGTGFNSRTGLKGLSFGVGISTSATVTTKETKDGKVVPHSGAVSASNASFGSSIPIGLQNYVPVITNESVQSTFQFQARLGGELYGTYPSVQLSIMKSSLHFNEDGSRKGYGYLYLEDASESDILDFSRDKEGYYNNTLKNLPLASLTYDIYDITGQGTGGMFRPFRNDIGTIYDPLVNPPTSKTKDLKVEVGIGNLFEAGGDMTFYENDSRSGAWTKLPFRGDADGSPYEKAFFKQAGELTYNNQEQTTAIFNNNPQYVLENGSNLNGKGRSGVGSLPSKYGDSYVYNGSNTDRTTRSNLLSYFTAEDASIPDVAQASGVISYHDSASQPFWVAGCSTAARYGTSPNLAHKKHISEFTQTLPDGRRYIYGIPAINNVTKEVTFGVSKSNADLNTGLVTIESGDDSKSNGRGKEHFYSYTGTPAYAYSYLLTSVLSNDYVDILGDGPTDDDLGSFTKINYTKWDDDYRWRAPYNNDKAQYNPGFWSDDDDDKGSYIMGSKEIWHIRSIETKNYVAEFYVSPRNDGKGSTNWILPSNSKVDGPGNVYSNGKSSESYSYKLDSIKLYNKHDRYINEANAIPVKTVVFKYSYRLCKGIPNSFDPNSTDSDSLRGGKLTLERIYLKYGNSQKNLLSPYVFTYSETNPHYNFACKDRWGYYKPQDPTISNFEYPYVKQDTTDANNNVLAWNLTDVKLPSGGIIHVDYESDDYSYVQNKRTMQMFSIEGVGNTINLEEKNNLYESVDNVNNYVYFKRRISEENPNISMRNNYLEESDMLYYSFDLDISGKGKYEHIKGYAKIDDGTDHGVGICPNDTMYGYIRLKKERPGANSSRLLHPATIYGLNIGRYYLPHIIYPGYDVGTDPIKIMHALLNNAKDIFSLGANPIVTFVERDRKAKNCVLSKSWIRLNVPSQNKLGGGLRVRQLTLNDSWSKISSNPEDATYGKHYDYTIFSDKWGRNISSGVASYEPMIGGDENPFKMPVKYTADAGRLMPAIEFFQEEPFGESFFPSPVVGYSSVKVSSIHSLNARSAQYQEEHNFYTAKDFPIEVDYTEKDAPNPVKTHTLRKKYEEVKVMQGYVLRFNDMHGKPQSTSYYVIKTDGTNASKELVSCMNYKYAVDDKNHLDNKVKAVVRDRGNKTYSVQDIRLGEEMDFTIDSRERDIKSASKNIDINCNVFLIGIIPIPVPTGFFLDKEEQTIFKSLVSTKVIQRYGILKSVETYDRGAKTVVENLLYDAETGKVLLSKTNNEYTDANYDLNKPAYWTYNGMGPAYRNIGFKESNVSFKAADYGELSVSDKTKYNIGDELLLGYRKDNIDYTVKVWVVDYGVFNDGLPINGSAYSYRNWQGGYGVPTEPSYLWVMPRYMYKNSTIQWPGLSKNETISNVSVRVLRSGRRNNLDMSSENTELASNPMNNDLDILFGHSSSATAYSKVINASARTFTEFADPYSSDSGEHWMFSPVSGGNYYRPEVYPVNIVVGGDTLKTFNKYVLGHRGNFRPQSAFAFHAKRDYSSNNIRYDGTFSLLNNTFGGASSSYWKLVDNISRYDVFGNAIEESDALGKYSSSQYGYNKTLPIAVATNVRQKGFCFEGFEDYNSLVPANLRALYTSYYYYFSPFARFFNEVQSNMKRYNQNYVRLNLTATNGDVITSAASHTGFYSLSCSSNRTFDLRLGNAEIEFPGLLSTGNYSKGFSLDTNRRYVASLWLKPISGGPSSIANSCEFTITNGSGVSQEAFQLKTANIDGWYKADCILDLSNSVTALSLTLPTGAYFDDIRFIPVDASMKSFVYDPITFKLIAQLDENNYATFYEYDQEGLLIRVKKETDKGIVTINESRRSTSKLQ